MGKEHIGARGNGNSYPKTIEKHRITEAGGKSSKGEDGKTHRRTEWRKKGRRQGGGQGKIYGERRQRARREKLLSTNDEARTHLEARKKETDAYQKQIQVEPETAIRRPNGRNTVRNKTQWEDSVTGYRKGATVAEQRTSGKRGQG